LPVLIECTNCTEIFNNQVDYARHTKDEHPDDKLRLEWAKTVLANEQARIENEITARVVQIDKEKTTNIFRKKKVEVAPAIIPNSSISELQLATARESKLQQVSDILENRQENSKIPKVLVSLIEIYPEEKEQRVIWKRALLAIIELLYPD
jgi:hypothetical protein